MAKQDYPKEIITDIIKPTKIMHHALVGLTVNSYHSAQLTAYLEKNNKYTIKSIGYTHRVLNKESGLSLNRFPENIRDMVPPLKKDKIDTPETDSIVEFQFPEQYPLEKVLDYFKAFNNGFINELNQEEIIKKDCSKDPSYFRNFLPK